MASPVDDAGALALIREALCEVAPDKAAQFAALGPDTEIKDLGIDSIRVMEMLGNIEDRLGRTFAEDALSTVRATSGMSWRSSMAGRPRSAELQTPHRFCRKMPPAGRRQAPSTVKSGFGTVSPASSPRESCIGLGRRGGCGQCPDPIPVLTTVPRT